MGMSGAMRLANAIEAIIWTAEEAGQAVDVARVAQRLSVDFDEIKIPKAEIFEMVARECMKRPGFAVVLETSPAAPVQQTVPSNERESGPERLASVHSVVSGSTHSGVSFFTLLTGRLTR